MVPASHLPTISRASAPETFYRYLLSTYTVPGTYADRGKQEGAVPDFVTCLWILFPLTGMLCLTSMREGVPSLAVTLCA